MRLISAKRPSTLNIRGLGLPGCGRGVTVPSSMWLKPSAPSASRESPFLSKPAANPTGWANLKPKQCTDRPCGGSNAGNSGLKARKPASPRSWANSGSNRVRMGSAARAMADVLRCLMGRAPTRERLRVPGRGGSGRDGRVRIMHVGDFPAARGLEPHVRLLEEFVGHLLVRLEGLNAQQVA